MMSCKSFVLFHVGCVKCYQGRKSLPCIFAQFQIINLIPWNNSIIYVIFSIDSVG